MASYLFNWLSSAPAAQPTNQDDGSDTETETGTAPVTVHINVDNDDDTPPAFPSLSSAQRLAVAPAPRPPLSSSTLGSVPVPTLRLSDTELMPPPPLPIRAPGGGLPRPIPTRTQLNVGNTLAVPPTTTKPPTTLPTSTGTKSTTNGNFSGKKREKVALAPGHSPLDWANLKASGQDLRGIDAPNLLRVPPSLLKQHNKRDDAWSAFNGKVYNITPYIAFHPGGEKEIMRVAGRDGTKLFALTHAWVNVDFMLDACLVGFLVPEPRE
ncbi:hypothetical protein AMATHDRAFT_66474 [Amanita thiersii Skay4041]|uniref:Cytochrome b5 heme-binding domain-containing protein n=1 Tax=Amanita thiersii Skay4041 TaxID=703135 RepID=A0A2A9NF39_9AGAR|nr:hypothetical protein AMATHDRAFT_66474 [Amanita thiersii Skay4041]